MAVVRDEGLPRQVGLDHRVTPGGDLQGVAVVDLRCGPAVAGGYLRQGEQGIELGQGPRGCQEPGSLSGDQCGETRQGLALAEGDLLVGGQDARLGVLQRGGDVALAVGDGLLAGVVARHQGEVGAGDLDVVAEDFVEPDFQGADTGPLSFSSLQRGQPLPRVVYGGDGIVEIGGESGANHGGAGGVLCDRSLRAGRGGRGRGRGEPSPPCPPRSPSPPYPPLPLRWERGDGRGMVC